MQLAQTAKAVTLFQDYSLRARKSTDDELGILIDAFDEMLGAIQQNRAECERQRGWLEEELCARNGELRTVKAQLQQCRERAEAASQAQRQFFANRCERILTPLTGILGMTQLVLDTDLSVEQRASLLKLRVEADSLLAVLEAVSCTR